MHETAQAARRQMLGADQLAARRELRADFVAELREYERRDRTFALVDYPEDGRGVGQHPERGHGRMVGTLICVVMKGIRQLRFHLLDTAYVNSGPLERICRFGRREIFRVWETTDAANTRIDMANRRHLCPSVPYAYRAIRPATQVRVFGLRM